METKPTDRCTGCGATRETAVKAVAEGKLACCPEPKFLTMELYIDHQEKELKQLHGKLGDLLTIVDRTRRMRELQKKYFQSRDKKIMLDSKRVEAEVDELLHNLTSPKMF